MKRIFTLDVKAYDSLKVRRHTLVITCYEINSNSKGKIKDKETPSAHPVIVPEVDDLKTETGSTKAIEILENVGDFQHGPTNGKFLKRHFP